MTHAQWQARYEKLRGIADRIQDYRRRRANAIWARAMGSDPRVWCWDGCAIHNCSISDVGTGWGAGPDGRKRIRAARHALRVMDSAFDPSRIVSAWDRRVRGLG